jgi:hypothetical protein
MKPGEEVTSLKLNKMPFYNGKAFYLVETLLYIC